MCAALRPDNINWPKNPDNDNKVSFKLTELTKANGLDHYKAHDALSDVYATIALAKLIQSAQPKLFNYLLSTRKKDFVSKVVNILEEPIVHSTRMVKSEYFGTSVFLPLFRDPSFLLTINN
jgi:exodeoxyribonuclease-1